jgi:hypothetical protein
MMGFQQTPTLPIPPSQECQAMLARFLGFTMLLMAIFALPGSNAQDSKSKSSDSSNTTIDADTLKEGEYLGKLLAAPSEDGQFTLRFENKEPKDAAVASRAADALNGEVQRARQLEQQVAANPTPQRISALQAAYKRIRKEQERQRDLYNTTYKDIEFHAATDMVVRFRLPPVVYDDKGEQKKYSQLDLQEMRGSNPNVPGFQAKVTDLQPNQIIRVSLRQARAPSADKSTTVNSTDKDKEKDKTKAAPKMEAVMILVVIAEDLTPVSQDNKNAAKKKK